MEPIYGVSLTRRDRIAVVKCAHVMPFDADCCDGAEDHVPAPLMRDVPDLAAALDAFTRGDFEAQLADKVYQEGLDDPDGLLDDGET